MLESKYSVTQIKPGIFQFTTTSFEEGEINVYIMENPCSEEKKLVFKTLDHNFNIKLLDLDYRPYFIIEKNSERYLVAERTLLIDGMNNFRDMGGYETYDERTVKWGRLYRADHIYNATKNGVEYLKKLNIRTIIDYRSNDEISKYPNKMINNCIKTYELDPAAHTAELSAQFTSSKDNEDLNLVNKIIEQKRNGTLVNRYDMVMKQYENFVNKEKSKLAYSTMIKIAADPLSHAIVQHCRGGKDRTGFGSMLLLGILGVKKEYLIYDYMLTHTNRISRNNKKMEGYKELTNDPDILNYLYSLIETKAEFIEASIDCIESKYGSIKNYAMEELEVTQEMISILENLYLE